MYKINSNEVKQLKMLKYDYYSIKLNVTPQHICNILNGKITCTGLLARGIISVCFNLSLIDSKMEEMVEKYFIKQEKE